MYELQTLLIFLVAFFATLYLTKKFISRFHSGGFVVRDMYKPERPNIPTMGGIALIGGIMVSLVASEVLIRNTDFIVKLLLFYFVIFIYGMFGLLDDLIRIKSRFKKIYILFFLALPIALLQVSGDINIPFINVSFHIGWVKAFIIAPLYVMVVANLINMHAGFNGLDSGLTCVLLMFAGLKAYNQQDGDTLLYLAPVLGGIIAFFWYNKYPSRIFSGNTGSLMFGAAVGGLLILYNLLIFGIIILIPHIINFILWTYWVLNMRIYPHIKFAEVLPDGTIKPPNKLTLKYLVTSLFKVNELTATLILYAITIVFCVLGIFLIP
jgi:UDP-N-acetylglucosamine--dolichyl-phosphate N-acetylglucosaminephosphotransferase